MKRRSGGKASCFFLRRLVMVMRGGGGGVFTGARCCRCRRVHGSGGGTGWKIGSLTVRRAQTSVAPRCICSMGVPRTTLQMHTLGGPMMLRNAGYFRNPRRFSSMRFHQRRRKAVECSSVTRIKCAPRFFHGVKPHHLRVVGLHPTLRECPPLNVCSASKSESGMIAYLIWTFVCLLWGSVIISGYLQDRRCNP